MSSHDDRGAGIDLAPGVTVSKCLDCGCEAFPPRLRCPACGSDRGRSATAECGRIAERTIVRRAVGGELPEPVSIGTVHADGGAVMVARLDPDLDEGDRVVLFTDTGAPVARRAP